MDDASSSPDRSTTASDDALTTARIGKIREELERELAQLKHRLSVAWPRKVLLEGEGQYDAAADHVAAKKRAADQCDRLQECRDEVLGALDRIQEGSYGRCTICGELIPYKRLEVVPETLTCVRCCT